MKAVIAPMKAGRILLLLLSYQFSVAQNLVLNGDFEMYSGCPSGLEQLDSALYWINPSDSGTTLPGTPDYFNQCSSGTPANVPATFIGYQPAKSGGGYCGIALFHNSITDYREYAEGELSSVMSSGSCYFIEMFANLGNGSRYSTNEIQVYFSDTKISGIGNWNPLPFVPQLTLTSAANLDTATWKKFSATYFATGNEKHFIIGNYKDDASSNITLVNNSAFAAVAYCFIDDVSITPCTGIDDYESDEGKISVFPNPANELATITIPGDRSINQLRIIEKNGKIISEQKPGPPLSDQLLLETGGLSPGMYILELIFPESTKRIKFVKQ